jgi:flagellar basal-body rod protein FlgF
LSKALWPSVSGAIARDHAVEVTANNLANMNSTGFKRDQVSFKEVLAKNQNPNLQPSFHPGPTKDKDLYPIDGRDQAFVMIGGTHTDHTPGGFKVTDNPLDIAIEGPGLIEAATPTGVKFFRSGSLKIAADGTLTTSEGHPVLSARANPNVDSPEQMQDDPRSRMINLSNRDGSLHINSAGELYMGEDFIGKLSLVEFQNLDGLRKFGSAAYTNPDVAANPQIAPTNTQVRQGMIETSNVNPVQEISNLIRANRMFELDLKAMKTVDGMMAKEANEVGKF